MDPLSVTASILGILVASQKISEYIGMITTKSKRAPEELLELKSTIDTTHAILSQLQLTLLRQVTVNPTRTALVLVDQVIVILTTCVKIFSDLNTMIEPLNSTAKIAMLDRIRWATKTNEVKEHLLKVEMQKNSLNLILTILTCESNFEATAAVGRLEELVTRVLEGQEMLSKRLLEPGNMSTFTRDLAEDLFSSVEDDAGDATIRVFEFQQDLESSRVYSRCRWLDSDTSSIGTRNSTLAGWSMISGLSLSNITNIGILALPITIDELSNGQCYIQASTVQPIPDTPKEATTLQTSKRPITFMASTEYEIEDWGIKIKLGTLGVTAQLIDRSFTHHDIIWVVPCFGNIDYPIDQITESVEVQVENKRVSVTVQYHVSRNVTYVLLDCEEFRSVTKGDQSEYGLGTSMSLQHCSIWNQAIAKIMLRFEFDQYLIHDMRSALALLYMLPRTIPFCFMNYEYGSQLWQNIRLDNVQKFHRVSSSFADLFNLDNSTLRRYFANVQKLDLIYMIATYQKYHQKGRGFVSIGPKSTYDKSSITHQSISRAGLTKIVHLNFPDPTDTDPWELSEEKKIQSDKQRLLKINKQNEASRPANKAKLQEWAGLASNPEAQILIFVGRWSFETGIDLFFNVMSTILSSHGTTQFIAVGPTSDQYGREAARNLSTLSHRFPGRVYIKADYITLASCAFTGSEFALLPSRYDASGLVSIEFGRKGAISVGSIIGGKGQVPGFWYKGMGVVKTETLEKRFRKAIVTALASSLEERRLMRATCAMSRFPVALWLREIDGVLNDCVRYHGRQ